MGILAVTVGLTPEHRAKIAQLKKMVAKACGLFGSDLEACAELVADIFLEQAKINPQEADEISEVQEQANYFRSLSKPPTNVDSDWQQDAFIVLGNRLRTMSNKLDILEWGMTVESETIH
jgi:hypothetical protein